MKRNLFFLLLIAVSFKVCPQTNVYPMHWWVGMKHHAIQLMVHGHNIKGLKARSAYPGFKVISTQDVENPNYLFINVDIAATARPGSLNIELWKESEKKETIPFAIKARRQGNGITYAQGLSSKDFIYLLMPDRFANGDESNDRIGGLRDQSLNRDSMYDRHGGDLQGVKQHLDYLQDLGVTALWMTPVIANDMPNRTEHGYAFTDHYKIEPRFGGEAAYKALSDDLHRRGMKLVQDAVYNHCGLYHFFIQDMPMRDWVHQWPAYTNTTYKDQPLFDTYAAESDKKIMSDGWFTRQMPDLNQGNPFVANFLIQHAIWSVEEFGVDAWRIDTYIYNDLAFMNRCNQALFDEYPKITMFGETWVHGVVSQSYFTRNKVSYGFKSNLPAVTDFQTNLYGINPALTQPFGWTEGVNRLYQTLSQDVLYQDAAQQNIIFLDNHDMTRFMSQVGEDTAKLKMGIGWLLTCRGIPELYYGTELIMKGISYPDGLVRMDFKGGWKEDAAANKFTAAGRTVAENDMVAWTKVLANFRKSSPALTSGRLMQYVPEDGVYTYFRYTPQQTVMVVMNTNAAEKELTLNRFSERTSGFSGAVALSGGERRNLTGTWKLPAKTILVMELK